MKKFCIIFWALIFVSPFSLLVGMESNNQPFSDIFSYDLATGLHVKMMDPKQQYLVREIQEYDIPFYQKIFSNEEVMKNFGSGVPHDKEYVQNRCEISINDRFGKGHPHGFMTIIDPKTNQPFMYAIAGLGGYKGESEIACAMLPDYQGQKIGTQLSCLVKTWAPEVRRIGLGVNLDPNKHDKIIKKFCCFDGEPLKQLNATASPDNPASWQILDKLEFKAAVNNVTQGTIINLDNKELNVIVTEELLKLFDPNITEKPLVPGKRYAMIGLNGDKRTFSKHANYNVIKYHFEKVIKHHFEQ